jgi:hypothetical protein
VVRSVNSFLDGSESGAWVSQTARLMEPRADSSGRVATRLAALRPGTLRADRARLVVVDHPLSTVAVVSGDSVAIGQKRGASRLMLSSGEDLTGHVGGVLHESRIFGTGATLELLFGPSDSLAGLVVDCARAGNVVGGAAWGVQVEVPDSAGWGVAGGIHPRAGHDELAVPLVGATQARLVFLSDVEVGDVAGYSLVAQGGDDDQVAILACATASAENGAVVLADVDSVAVELAQGQGVSMWFDGPPPVENMRRTYFLDLVASFTPEGAATQMSSRVGADGLPLTFALHSNRPNPFGGVTSVRFDVPRPSDVRVEIFDAMGRRVRTLADRRFQPGTHSVEWDGTDGHGHRVRPGVYLYRMISDDFRDQRRMVLLGR